MDKVLEEAIKKIEKDYGKGTIQSFKDVDRTIERVSSGSLGLDCALGGGWPKGRIIEIYGPESSGKSTLALHAIAETQKNGGVAAYIDAEHAFDPTYAESLGVDLSDDFFIFSQPDNGEQGISLVGELVHTGKVGIVVVDSVAALTPKAEIEGEVGENKMGLHARLMSQAMRKLVGTINKTDCIVIFINQLRDKIGVMFGNPETTTGGNALKFYASIRCDIRRISIEKDKEDNAISNKVKVKVIKNKTAPPFRQAEFNLVYGEGIDVLSELIEVSVQFEIIKKSGSWYSYKESKLGQGIDNVKELLKDNFEMVEDIREQLLKKLNLK